MTTVTAETAAKSAARQAAAQAYADGLFATAMRPGVVGLTDSANIAINCDAGLFFAVTLAATRTLANPTGNPVDGQTMLVRVTQGGAGNFALNFGTNYRFGSDLPSITLSTATGKTDYIGIKYNAVSTKWDVLAFNKGF